MILREKFWRVYVEMKTTELYFAYYGDRSKKISDIITGFLLIAGTSSIATWAIWQKHAIVWSIIIAISHVVACLQPLMPFKDREVAVKLMLPELENETFLLETQWDNITPLDDTCTLNDEKISTLIFEHRKRLKEIEQKYSSRFIFPHNYKLLEMAENSRNQEFKLLYNVERIDLNE